MKFGRLLSDLFGEAATRGDAAAVAAAAGGAAPAGGCADKGAAGEGGDVRPVLRYKALKKLIKAHAAAEQQRRAGSSSGGGEAAAPAAAAGGGTPAPPQQAGDESTPQQQQQQAAEWGAQPFAELSPDDALFIKTLNEDLARLNDFFVEKEEESVIKLQALSDRLQELKARAAQEQADADSAASGPRPAAVPRAVSEAARALRAELVDLHGSMVLLQHHSMLNYSGLVKIIKKKDKNSGVRLRGPLLASILRQPFNSHGVMCRLVRTAEEQLDALAASGLLPSDDPASSDGGGGSGGGANPRGRAAAEVFRQTQQALDTWQELRATAKTPSTVLPAEGGELMRQLAAAAGLGTNGVNGAAPAAPACPAATVPARPAAAAGVKREAAAAAGEEEGRDGSSEPDAKRAHLAA